MRDLRIEGVEKLSIRYDANRSAYVKCYVRVKELLYSVTYFISSEMINDKEKLTKFLTFKTKEFIKKI